jgi:hypothetical protein
MHGFDAEPVGGGDVGGVVVDEDTLLRGQRDFLEQVVVDLSI